MITASHPPRAVRHSTWAMTRDVLLKGLEYDDGMMGRLAGHDFSRFRSGTRRYVAITHPDHVDHVLHAGRERYVKSFEYETLRAAVGVSLITDEGESWRRHRRLLTPLFAKRHLDGLLELMEEPIAELADSLERGGPRQELEMASTMVDLTLAVVGRALFSRSFDQLGGDTAALLTAGMRSAERLERLFLAAAPPRPAFRAFARCLYSPVPLPPPLRTMQSVARGLDAAVWAVVRERRADPIESNDLLGHLLGVQEDGEALPLRRVRDEALTFMLAGHETTANALAWMWYLLALNPGARERMLDEVDEVLGDRRPTLADLGRLPWTTACFEEAMRYLPPVWILPRTAVEDDIIGGHRVRKGTTVLIPVHLLHHDERWWDCPGDFDPSRFLPGADSGRPRSAYLPFGGGRRICIGRSFALMEGVLITAMLSRRFTFDLVPGHPVDREATLTLRPRHGIRMVARRRAAA